MKKILASTIIATSMFSPFMLSSQHNTQAATNTSVTSQNALSNTKINLDVSPESLQKMKDGAFDFKGISLNSTIGDVKKNFGQFNSYTLLKDSNEKSTISMLTFGKNNELIIIGERNQFQPSMSDSELKVTNIMFDMSGKKLEKKTVEKTLGPALKSMGSLKDDIFVRQYGKNLQITYIKDESSKKIIVDNISFIKKDTKNYASQVNKGLNLNSKNIDVLLTKDNIASLKQGRYQFKKEVGLGTQMKNIKSSLGSPLVELIQYENGLTNYIMLYGKDADLSIQSTVKGYLNMSEIGNMRVSEMAFNKFENSKDDFKIAVEKYTGKATRYKGNYKKDNYLERSYGENFDIVYNRENKSEPFKVAIFNQHVKKDKNGLYIFKDSMLAQPQQQ